MYVNGDISGTRLNLTSDISANIIKTNGIFAYGDISGTRLNLTSDLSANIITTRGMNINGDISGSWLKINANSTMTGYQAGNGTTIGTSISSGNVGNGYQALYSGTSINNGNNVAIGYKALYTNDTSGNVAIGYKSLYANSSGYQNIGVGFQALVANSTGYSNTAVGSNALGANISGLQNSAFGTLSLNNSIITSNNSAFGVSSMANLITGNDNSAFGLESLRDSSGNYNSAVGSQSLRINNGLYNTAIGYGSGKSNTGINNTICIGPNTKLTSSNSGILKFSTTENTGTSYPVSNQFWFGDPTNGFINLISGSMSFNNHSKIITGGSITSIDHTFDTSGSMLYCSTSGLTTNSTTTLNLTGVPTAANKTYELKVLIVQGTLYYTNLIMGTINGTSITNKKTIVTTNGVTDYTLYIITIFVDSTGTFYILTKSERYT
jgi:hypothetical protein